MSSSSIHFLWRPYCHRLFLNSSTVGGWSVILVVSSVLLWPAGLVGASGISVLCSLMRVHLFLEEERWGYCLLIDVCMKMNLVLKGQFNQKSKTYIFTLACGAIYPSRLFWRELQRCLPSLQCDGTKRHSACGAQSIKTFIWKIQISMSLSKNHDPISQNNLQTLSWAVSCRNYFLSIRKKVVLVDRTAERK